MKLILSLFTGVGLFDESRCDLALKDLCACGCGRPVEGGRKTYDYACRKRLSRKKGA